MRWAVDSPKSGSWEALAATAGGSSSTPVAAARPVVLQEPLQGCPEPRVWVHSAVSLPGWPHSRLLALLAGRPPRKGVLPCSPAVTICPGAASRSGTRLIT